MQHSQIASPAVTVSAVIVPGVSIAAMPALPAPRIAVAYATPNRGRQS